ncbi:hypothetical protein DV704_10320 [Meiothermus sp. QL-1]|uniref:hypothetical protein n=1 Tax=Meiothermus sp. QL-1 TaxID=2058095 RepID=UPI000E0A0550|nr:hypothetical protein [Meiothermus sp. QL-1]RDI94690.1 hypothetical protein DV704_10320 [Meiothermus sp. QL-1]
MTALPASQSFLEESPEEFWQRFGRFAQPLPVCPEPLGSPVLEVLTPLGPLYAFDRGLIPLWGGSPSLLLHGQVEHWEEGPSLRAFVRDLGGGRYALGGRVGALVERGFFLLELPAEGKVVRVLLAADHPPAPDTWVTAWLRPPLMAFRPEAPVQ